jgi:hypothetical protein
VFNFIRVFVSPKFGVGLFSYAGYVNFDANPAIFFSDKLVGAFFQPPNNLASLEIDSEESSSLELTLSSV